MDITFTLTVPPQVARDPDALTAWFQTFIPPGIDPLSLSATASIPDGLTLTLPRTFATLADARDALKSFYRQNDTLPEPEPWTPPEIG